LSAAAPYDAQPVGGRAHGLHRGRAILAPTDDAAGRGLHARLLAGDPTAPADLARTYLYGLVAWLGRYSPGADPADRRRAAEDAIRGLLGNPDRYQPDRQRLGVYLRVLAAGALKGRWRVQRV
jgi:hypothetical protein